MHKQFNWKDCVSNFTLQQTKDLAGERAVAELTIEGLRNRELIGACFVAKWQARCLCFPISTPKGDVFRAHCRSPKRNSAGKWDWAYEPAKDPQDFRQIPALAFGNPDTATKRLIFESQWDAISAVDTLALFDEIDSGETCLITTRGAEISNRLEAFNWPAAAGANGIAVYIFPQNDEHGRKWLNDVLKATGGAYVVGIPAPHKDLGDWVKNGAAAAYDIEGAMDNAEFKQPAAASADADIEEDELEELRPAWPIMREEAFYGVLGQITRDIGPETQSDQAAILVQLILCFGSTIGRSAYYPVEGTRHHTNLFAVLVGQSARSRKGTSWDRVRQVFQAIKELPPIKSGLSSGEGLIEAVHDEVTRWVPKSKTEPARWIVERPSVDDKRLYVAEPEFARVFAVIAREKNTLSEYIREGWDHGNLGSMTKNNAIKATDAHICICGQITREELFSKLQEVDIRNGFANRFLWPCVKRSKLLPDGGETDIWKITQALPGLAKATKWARGALELGRDQEAQKLWQDIYAGLNRDIPGAFGAVTSRADAQVLRLSMIFALTDMTIEIRLEHLKAALAVWQYCEDSARYLFADPVIDARILKLYKALKAAGSNGLSQTQIIVDVFQKNTSASKIKQWLTILHQLGHVTSERRSPEGAGIKPTEFWRIVS